MDDNKMWFGNRNYMQWIPCPQVGADYTISGSQQSSEYLNGGSFIRNSMNKTKVFGLSWSLTSRENIRGVTDYAEGVFGPGPIFWSDPMTMDTNVLAQVLATPSLGGYDAPTLNGSKTRPALVNTSSNTLGYPTQSAIYTLNSTTDVPLRHYVPIPPGYTAWVGAHGVAGTGAVYVQPTKGTATVGAAQALTMLSVTNTTRFNKSVPWSATVDGIEIYLGGNGSLTLSGVMVQVLKTGTTPSVGGFISGQGHSGCDWSSLPSRDAYSRALDLMGVSATLTETEQWR